MLYSSSRRLSATVNLSLTCSERKPERLRRIRIENVLVMRFVHCDCDQSGRYLCCDYLVPLVLLPKTTAAAVRSECSIHIGEGNLPFIWRQNHGLPSFKSAFVTDIMNSGLMLCIEPDWMDALYDEHFDDFNIFEDVSEPFIVMLHQMFLGMDERMMRLRIDECLSLCS